MSAMVTFRGGVSGGTDVLYLCDLLPAMWLCHFVVICYLVMSLSRDRYQQAGHFVRSNEPEHFDLSRRPRIAAAGHCVFLSSAIAARPPRLACCD